MSLCSPFNVRAPFRALSAPEGPVSKFKSSPNVHKDRGSQLPAFPLCPKGFRLIASFLLGGWGIDLFHPQWDSPEMGNEVPCL